MSKKLTFATLLLAIPLATQAADYTVDYAQSEVAFTGSHAGNGFKGVFEDWNAELHFDPDDLAGSSLVAQFQLATAKTGDRTYDGTLPQADWFNVESHPEAVFTSESITSKPDGTYSANGILTIRGLAKPVSFDFMLTDLASPPVTATAQLTLARMQWGLGQKSDPSAEWVSADIGVSIKVVASPVQ